MTLPELITSGRDLREINEKALSKTREVWAAVAYATDAELLFNHCWDKGIRLKFYGRLDSRGIPVKTSILSEFLIMQSDNSACFLVEGHHAKVIWWHGFGVYIGSANLTKPAWGGNVEAGCFFSESKITGTMKNNLRTFFKTLEAKARPLDEETLEVMKNLERKYAKQRRDPELQELQKRLFPTSDSKRPQISGRRQRSLEAFLEDWDVILRHLEYIGKKARLSDNRPSWVRDSVPVTSLTDQFLHAHYFENVSRKGNLETLFNENRNRPDDALDEKLTWWSELSEDRKNEDKMLHETAPELRNLLSEQNLGGMKYRDFQKVCRGVHAILRTAKYCDGGDKVATLSRIIWNTRAPNGARVDQVLQYILYGEGGDDYLPDRLWEATRNSSEWKIDKLALGSLGELVGWALPHQFPPVNGRTLKAMKSLGFDVNIHVK